MNPYNFKKILFASFICLFSFVACNNKPDDKEIQKKVDDQMQADARFAGITATVNNGIVTLTGECEGADCASNIGREIKQNDKVDSVNNEIQMKVPETDLTLRTSVQTIISKYNGVDAEVALGVIVLRGTISKDQLQPLMTELSALNPIKIDNQMVVN